MKNTLLLFACILGLFACQSEPATSSSDQIAKMRSEIEKKKQEITDKKELDRLDEELKQLDDELRKVSGGGKAAAPPTAKGGAGTGNVKGSSVIMRSDASTQSEKKGTFNNNELVTVLQVKKAQNANEAILVKPLPLFTSATNTGESGFILPKGKAVMIERYDEGSDQLYISYQHPEKGKLYAQIGSDAVENIELASWFQVKRSSGETGWVFGKFLTLN